jgi:hypothetical protein
VDEEDYFVIADGTKHHCPSSGEGNVMNDFPEEWMYFGDPKLNTVFLHGKRPDDVIGDENWRRMVTFELFSFGRTRSWKRKLTGTDHYYVFTMVDKESSHEDMTQLINTLFDEPYVSHGTASDTGVTIRNSTKKLFLNETATITAVRNPQEGTVTWETLDGGTVQGIDDTSATLTAPGTPGTIHVRAEFMGMADTLALEVIDPAAIHLKYNAGGLDVEDWVSAANLIEGGKGYTFSFDPDTTKATDPAPAEIYKTVQHFDHSYNIDVPDGQYVVRLHFVMNSGGRRMNYAIEGEMVLSDYGVIEEAGGTEIAWVRDFPVTVSDGNGLQIEATGIDGSDVFEAGVEVIATGPSAAGTPRGIRPAVNAGLTVVTKGRGIVVSSTGGIGSRARLLSTDGKTLATADVQCGRAELVAPGPGVYLVSMTRGKGRLVRIP